MRGDAKLTSMVQAGAIDAWIHGEGIRRAGQGVTGLIQDLGTD